MGSSGAALTGLMFVVITLSATVRGRGTDAEIGAFGTPNVVHFCVVFLVAVILSAPWQALWNADLLLGLCGVGGVAYSLIVVRRARRQTAYDPVLEDWLWYMVFPLVSYIVLVVAAMILMVNPVVALFVVAAVTVLLLFIGIHNAWAAVVFIAFEVPESENKSQD